MPSTPIIGARGLGVGLALFVGLGSCAAVCLSCSGAAPMAKTEPEPAPTSAQETQPPAPLPPQYEVTHRVEFQTSRGTFVVGLYGKQAPATVANFLSYVDEGFYSGKIFHRVIPGFVVQGGGFDADLKRSETREPIALEIIPGLKHEAGTLSMARTNAPRSATSQFFICTAEAPQLNGGYAAFGALESGLEVIEAISMAPAGKRQVGDSEAPMEDVPLETVTILQAKRL